MTLSTEAITLIRESWAVLARDPERFAARFYDELFATAPELRRHFASTDLPLQRRKLAAALALLVRHVEDFASAVPALHDLGRRHVVLGIADADYDSVGRALLRVIERELGPLYLPATGKAWACAYTAVARTMQTGAATAFRQIA